VTCRVARSFQTHAQMDPVYCCKCGSSALEVLWTSKSVGPHLCPMCVQAGVDSGVAESLIQSSRRDWVEASTDPSVAKELQSTRDVLPAENVIRGPKEMLSRHESVSPVQSVRLV
jgi:hypothetical protein